MELDASELTFCRSISVVDIGALVDWLLTLSSISCHLVLSNWLSSRDRCIHMLTSLWSVLNSAWLRRVLRLLLWLNVDDLLSHWIGTIDLTLVLAVVMVLTVLVTVLVSVGILGVGEVRVKLADVCKVQLEAGFEKDVGPELGIVH